MKQIAVVSVNLQANNVMGEVLSSYQDIKVVQYLDGYLLDLSRKKGGITPDGLARMQAMVENACTDGANGIIIACTIYSPYASQFEKQYAVPVVGADFAMMEKCAQKGGRIALICTFEGTRDKSEKLLREYLDESKNEYELDTIVLKEAFAASEKMDMAKHDQIICDKIKEIDEAYDQIVLAQMSMARVCPLIKTEHAVLLTSPQAAYEALSEKMI